MATVVSTIGRLLSSRGGAEWVCLEADIVLTRCLTRGLHHLRRASSEHRQGMLIRTHVSHAPCTHRVVQRSFSLPNTSYPSHGFSPGPTPGSPFKHAQGFSKIRERERDIILERPAAYKFENKHSNCGLGEKGAVSCCTALAIVDRLHQIISRGISEMGARSPSP